MDFLRSLFGGDDPYVMRKEFFSLTTEIERNVTDGVRGEVVDMAARLRNMLRSSIKLNRSEKIRILKLINRAKVRALLLGTTSGDSIFRNLDSIGTDILRLI